ncbi:MAG: BrnT family toxin [Desulfatitalea sp.]|nr:BrnT family toxin [Desulfatitalea sp.]
MNGINQKPRKTYQNTVSFSLIFAVFDDPNAVTLDDSGSNEQRYITIGMDAFGRILVAVYTWRGDNIRIIWVQFFLAPVSAIIFIN